MTRDELVARVEGYAASAGLSVSDAIPELLEAGLANRTAIAGIAEGSWRPIRYPQAVWDDQLGCWISDAEVAEATCTAFTSKKKALHVTARLIVRRVRDKGKATPGLGELFPAWRYRAVFTDSPYELIQAEEQHRGHAIIELLLADLNDGPPLHLPSGSSARTPPGWPSPPSPITWPWPLVLKWASLATRIGTTCL